MALAVGVALAGISFGLALRQKTGWAIAVLTLAALVLRISAAFLDPFLNTWDEMFHAIVARNMMVHPFTPMLYTETAMPITTHWPHQHIWLHKPPFFLWQMALSMKVFGVAPWTIRIPSAIWTAALVPATWRVGGLLHDKRTGFAAAVLVAFSFLLQQLTTGALCTEQNDAIFIATVGFSLWALLEYWHDGSWKWAVAVGVFSATAILTKWYVGLLVFLPWGIAVIYRRFPVPKLSHLLIGLITMLIFVMPWVLYIHWRFPKETAFESHDSWLRLTMPFEGHAGTWMFHFEALKDLVPPLTIWLVLPALVWSVIAVRSAEHRIFLLSTVVGVHLFFMAAQTKMLCYTMVLVPIYMVLAGHALRSITAWIPERKDRSAVFFLSLAVLAGYALNIGRYVRDHTVRDPPEGPQYWRVQQLAAAPAMDSLATFLHDPSHEVVFNFPAAHCYQFMFARRYQCWDKMPSWEDVARLNAAGYTVYALQDGRAMGEFPEGVVVIPDSVVSIPRIRRM
jgi:4-amino-4-deoxy-L-arabinose transferase